MIPDAFVAPSSLAAVEVTGGDRATFLHNVLTQDVVALQPGEVAGALYLDAHGSPLAVMDVAVVEDRHLLLVPDEEVADSLSTTLGGRTFLADVRLELTDVEAVSLRGERTQELAAAAGLEISDGQVRELDEVLLVGRVGGLDLVGSALRVAALADDLVGAGAQLADASILDDWHVASARPRWGHEIRPPHLPEEMGLLPTHVHLAKGCYPGQEAVARMWMLGRPRRALAAVIVDGDVAPGWRAGSGREAVEVTGVVTHDGERVGLAYVPTGASPGDRYGEEDAAIIVRELVGAGLPVPGQDPNVTRRRDSRRSKAT